MKNNLKSGLIGRIGRAGSAGLLLVVLAAAGANSSGRPSAIPASGEAVSVASTLNQSGQTKLAGILLSKRTRLIINFKATMLA